MNQPLTFLYLSGASMGHKPFNCNTRWENDVQYLKCCVIVLLMTLALALSGETRSQPRSAIVDFGESASTFHPVIRSSSIGGLAKGSLIESPDNGIWSAFGGIDNGCAGVVIAQALASNGDLYVGGNFRACGDIAATNIARWDGTSWSSLGEIGPLESVLAIAVSGNDVYVAGQFESVGGIPAMNVARWDGSSWSALDEGLASASLYSAATAIVVNGGYVYVGGQFDLAGGAPANGIARWSIANQTWSSVGSGAGGVTIGGSPGQVNALAIFNSQVVVGGNFDSAGGQPASRVAAWNGTVWASLGNGVNSPVSAIAADATQLYIGGSFTASGAVTLNRVAKWDGTAWAPLSSGGTVGTNRDVLAMALAPDGLYVGGRFTQAGGVAHPYIARWSGGEWHAVGGGFAPLSGTYVVRSLVWGNGFLYTGGSFDHAGPTPANFVAKWNGAAWSTLEAPPGNGSASNIYSAANYGGQACYGSFYPIRYGMGRLACWNGIGWEILGGQPTNGFPINALYSSGPDIYVGGYQSHFPNSCCIERWDGTTWNALGGGVEEEVSAILVDGIDVYVGGGYLTIGGTTGNSIGRWDGVAWNTVGGGTNGYVTALAKFGGRVIAGGSFTTAGGISAGNIAAWNGSAWEPMGTGVNGYIQALEVVGNRLYVGGGFDQAGGIAATSLAVWDGASWTAAGGAAANGVGYQGGGGTVYALEASGGALFIGGIFDRAGDISAKNLARFDGSIFTSLGAGAANGIANPGYVKSLAMRGATLLIGGIFGSAGGEVSANVAEYTPDQIMSNGTFE